MRLAASDTGDDGEQEITILNAQVDTIVKTSLPLLNSVVEGQVGTVRITLTDKAHTIVPTSIDIELFDDDDPDDADIFATPQPGKGSITQSLARSVTVNTGAPLAANEGLMNRSFSTLKTFNTKGTSGALGLILRINGGTLSAGGYTFVAQVNGKALRSA